jgi:hypothetical protein
MSSPGQHRIKPQGSSRVVEEEELHEGCPRALCARMAGVRRRMSLASEVDAARCDCVMRDRRSFLL